MKIHLQGVRNLKKMKTSVWYEDTLLRNKKSQEYEDFMKVLCLSPNSAKPLKVSIK